MKLPKTRGILLKQLGPIEDADATLPNSLLKQFGVMKCYECKVIKKPEEFERNLKFKSGYYNRCKKCRSTT